MDDLDDEGKQLYQEYLIAQSRWINYIKPKAYQKLNNYLDSNNKIYNQYEYLNTKINNDMLDKFNNSDKKQSSELTSKYKKLSLLFHPDKFIHPQSSDLFILIKQFYKENNETILDILDIISHLILDKSLETHNNILDKLINKLKNLDINLLDKLKKIIPSRNATEILDILTNTQDIIENNLTTNILDNVSDKLNIDFLSSSVYGFYINDEKNKQYINNSYITENELIAKIQNTPSYSYDFIVFYGERYKDNPRILLAVTEWLQKQSTILQSENEQLKNLIKNVTSS